MQITMPKELTELYALTDRERLPSGHEEERPDTLFYADFKVAERFGMRDVRATMRNCGDLTRRDPSEVTELYMVLNRLIWEANENGNEQLENYYRKYYEEIYNLTENWSEKDKLHFFNVTD